MVSFVIILIKRLHVLYIYHTRGKSSVSIRNNRCSPVFPSHKHVNIWNHLTPTPKGPRDDESQLP
jgi:hypothetical protein